MSKKEEKHNTMKTVNAISTMRYVLNQGWTKILGHGEKQIICHDLGGLVAENTQPSKTYIGASTRTTNTWWIKHDDENNGLKKKKSFIE